MWWGISGRRKSMVLKLCISKAIDGNLQHHWENKPWYFFISLYGNWCSDFLGSKQYLGQSLGWNSGLGSPIKFQCPGCLPPWHMLVYLMFSWISRFYKAQQEALCQYHQVSFKSMKAVGSQLQYCSWVKPHEISTLHKQTWTLPFVSAKTIQDTKWKQQILWGRRRHVGTLFKSKIGPFHQTEHQPWKTNLVCVKQHCLSHCLLITAVFASFEKFAVEWQWR